MRPFASRMRFLPCLFFVQNFRTVNKFRYAAVSLIGAIPAAALFIILIMAVTDNPLDNMNLNVKILTFFTMTVGAFMVALPAGILIFGPKTEKSEETDEESSSSQDDKEDFAVSGSDEESDGDRLGSEEADGEEAGGEEPAAESKDEMVSEEDADIYETDDADK